MEKRTIQTMTYADFAVTPVWALKAGDAGQLTNPPLVPVTLAAGQKVPKELGELWCLCRARFADGTEHQAAGMCRGDEAIGPLMWSIWNGTQDVRLLVPPAPEFVLARQGPAPFAAKFGKPLAAVFPLTIRAVAEFAVEPAIRHVKIGVGGVQSG